MESIPIEVCDLGLGFNDYHKMASNVSRVLNMPHKWDDIIKRANLELSSRACDIGSKLASAMSNDKGFYYMAGIDYSKGAPVHGCFSVATADYLLRNKDKLNGSLLN